MRAVSPFDLVRAHTELTRPHLCPEIQLHLVTERCALWRATEADLERLGLGEPYWAFCWGGGQAVARYVLDRPSVVAGRRVLDLGAGCGIGAIAAATSGASFVVANDIDPVAAAAVQLNARLNGVVVETDDRDLLDAEPEPWDVVLAGDVCYETDLARRMVGWLEACARRSPGAQIIVGDPHRGFLPASKLAPVATYEVSADVDSDGRYLRPATVYASG